jgi:tetratricopeptide (TPR) repeat protein
MPIVPSGLSSPQKEASTVRLDSWKEIAAYLNRGERTAKRWEAERALPVHRLPGGGRGSVYAFTAELDEWLISANADKLDLDDEANEAIEDQREAEARESAVGSPQDAVQPARMSLTSFSAAMKAHGWSRHLLVFGLLLVGLALAADLLFHLRATGAHAFSALRWSQAKPTPASSDAEKQLAHELYLRGRFEWSERTPESLNRALDDFTQAIVHDPTDAQNYVGLADTYNLLREYSLMPQSEAFSRAIAASKKAVEIDDSLAEAHRSLAFGEIWGNGDFDKGLKEFERAIEINPRDPIAHLWFANAFQGPGWYPLCLREMNLAQELDPASPAILSDKGSLLFALGEREAGLEMEHQVARLEPQLLSPHRYLARMAWDLRDYPSYLRENEKVAELSHDSSLREMTATAQAGFQRHGERGLLENLYAAQERFYAAGSLAGIPLAKTAMRMGRKDEALLWVRREDERHRPDFIYLRDDPDLLPLLDDPVFRALRSKIHSPRPEEAIAAERALEISESGVQVAAKLP